MGRQSQYRRAQEQRDIRETERLGSLTSTSLLAYKFYSLRKLTGIRNFHSVKDNKPFSKVTLIYSQVIVSVYFLVQSVSLAYTDNVYVERIQIVRIYFKCLLVWSIKPVLASLC